MLITGHCASGYHDKCKAATTTPGGTIWRCSCDCHTGDEPVHDLRNPCKVCGTTLQIAHDCDGIIAKRDDDPTYRRLQEAKAMVEMKTNRVKPVRVKAEPKPKVGRCEYSGQPTKGGRFVAGNDARLKSILRSLAATGDVDALAELIARNWPTGEPKSKTQLAKATKRATPEWLAIQVQARFACWDEGGHPW